MNKKHLTICVLCFSMLFIAVSASFADDDYLISVSTADQYMDTQPTWYCDVITPAVSGMRSEAAQKALNEALAAEAQAIIDSYTKETTELAAEFTGDDKPHLGYDFDFRVISDSDDVFVFATEFFSVAGSSSTSTHYYTFDKDDGELVTFESLFDKRDYLQTLTDYIHGEMEEANKKGSAFFLDDGSLETAMAAVSENGHWYLDGDDDRLVIAFDKYEVAPGALGAFAFSIPESIMDQLD